MYVCFRHHEQWIFEVVLLVFLMRLENVFKRSPSLFFTLLFQSNIRSDIKRAQLIFKSEAVHLFQLLAHSMPHLIHWGRPHLLREIFSPAIFVWIRRLINLWLAWQSLVSCIDTFDSLSISLVVLVKKLPYFLSLFIVRQPVWHIRVWVILR